VIIGVFDKKASGQSFQNGADGVKIAGFFYGESANNRTLIGDDRDQSLGLKLTKGFADDGSRNTHHGNELTFYEAFSWVEAARDDGLTEFVEDLLTKRRGQFGDDGESGLGAQRA
jgi:hypothetical protein